MHSNDVKSRFGSTVRAYRSELGMSQEELAGRAGLHRTYISDVERGSRNVSLESIEKLAKALGVSLAALFSPKQPASSGLVGADHLPSANILLIEDDPDDLELTLKRLRDSKLNNHVRVARDGQEALHVLFGQAAEGRNPDHPKPDLIFLDLGLPAIPGLEVLRKIKEHPETREIPVIVLTGSEDDRNIHASKQLGAEAYLVKPVSFKNFSEAAVQAKVPWALLRPETSIRSSG